MQLKRLCRYTGLVILLSMGSGLVGLVVAQTESWGLLEQALFHPRQGGASIYGQVVLSDGMTPAVNAIVVPVPVARSPLEAWEMRTCTKEDGSYQCTDLAPGPYHLLVLAREPVSGEELSTAPRLRRSLDYDLPSVPRALRLAPTHPRLTQYLPEYLRTSLTAQDHHPQRAPTVKLRQGGSVSGRIQGVAHLTQPYRAMVTLKPDPSADNRDRFCKHVYEVGPDGYYRWDGIEPGVYQIIVQVEKVQDTSLSSTCRGVERSATGAVSWAPGIEVHAGEVTSGVDFTLPLT